MSLSTVISASTDTRKDCGMVPNASRVSFHAVTRLYGIIEIYIYGVSSQCLPLCLNSTSESDMRVSLQLNCALVYPQAKVTNIIGYPGFQILCRLLHLGAGKGLTNFGSAVSFPIWSELDQWFNPPQWKAYHYNLTLLQRSLLQTLNVERVQQDDNLGFLPSNLGEGIRMRIARTWVRCRLVPLFTQLWDAYSLLLLRIIPEN